MATNTIEHERGGATQTRLDAFDAVEVVDNAGVSLPPEEATSLRMAFAAGLINAGGTITAAAITQADDEAGFQQLHADAMAEARVMLERFGGPAAFAARVTSTDFADPSELDEPGSDDGECESADATGDVYDDAYDDNDDVGMEDTDCGMEGAEYSRAYSDVGDDGEWVLERIVTHRMGRHRGECSFDWDSAGAAPSGSATRVREYQCKWRGYTEPTWETAAALDRIGFGDDVAAYERAAQDRAAAALALRKNGQEEKKCPAKINLSRSKQQELLRSLFPFTGKVGADIALDLSLSGRYVTDVVFVAPPARTAAFFHHWGGNVDVVAPAVVYHGTGKESVPGICAHGLVVPGTDGVLMRNGATYGTGIYTATRATTSTPYMCPAGFMFICVGLVGLKFASTRTAGSQVPGRGNVPSGFVIFQQSSYVLPLWLVRIGSRDEGEPTHHASVRDMFAHFGLKQVDAAAAVQVRADEIMHKHFRQAPPKMQRKLRHSLQKLLLDGSIK